MDDTSLDDFLDAGEDDEGVEDGDNEGVADAPDSDTTPDASGDDAPATEADADAHDAGDGPATEADADAPDTDDSAVDVEPATTTYQWTPAGATCAACGETVERRWRGDEGLVCPNCKEW